MTRIEVLDAARFGELVARAAQIYGAAMGRAPELVVQRREIMRSHVTRAEFVGVGAFDAAGELVGFGYGYRGRAGEWWHDVVAAALGRELTRQWLADAFELAELHVDPPHQGAGIGRQVIETLLGRVTQHTVVLSTHDRDSPARSLYRSLGFVELVRNLVFPGSSEVYVILGKRR